MLEQTGTYNRFTEEFRSELENKVRGFGKTVTYKFDIAKENFDPQKYNGKEIYPFMYTLDPVVLRVQDKHEKRTGEQKLKQVGLVKEIDPEKGNPTAFFRIRIKEGQRGLLQLNLEDPEDFERAMYLELHPKLEDGEFQDKTKRAVMKRIDQKKLSEVKSKERSDRLKALTEAEGMSDKELVMFADGMMWDSTEDISILKDKVEEFAEAQPTLFLKLIEGDSLETQALVKQAMDNNVIAFDPGDYKFIWTATNQTIATLQAVADKNEVEKMAEWLLTGGKQGEEVCKKIKTLLK